MERQESDMYDVMMKEVLSKIEVYTNEWTNDSPSDPGITMLENLTTFQILLQKRIENVPKELKPKLLQLLGFEAREGENARVLLQPEYLREEIVLPPYQKFYAAGCCYETTRSVRLTPGKLCKVFLEKGGQIHEIEELSHGNPLSARLFTEHPQAGDVVYFLFDKLSVEPGEVVRLFVNVKELFPRNKGVREVKPEFAQISWSYFTKDGYALADCNDDTATFLIDGELKIRLGQKPPTQGEISGDKGYLIRCELMSCDYDISPCVTGIDGPLFEVYERDTGLISYEQPFREEIRIPKVFSGRARIWIYVKLKDCYIAYQVVNTEEQDEKRLWIEENDLILRIGGGCTGDGNIRDEVKTLRVVYCSEKMLERKVLGRIEGHDGQEFDVSLLGSLLPEALELMVSVDQDGTTGCFFYSLYGQNDEFLFEYDQSKAVIRILDPGEYVGCYLSLAGCAVYSGGKGNIRSQNQFVREGAHKKEVFYNPHTGKGGRDKEDMWDVQCRFRKSLQQVFSAVTAADYGALAMEVPGLCIHKTGAYRDCDGTIYVVVKPCSEEKLPKLSSHYRQLIREYLDGRKMLGTKMEVVGPRYVPIDVHLSVKTSPQSADCEQEIYSLIEQELDYVSSEKNFGATVFFRQVFKAIEKLSCVEYIQELSFITAYNKTIQSGRDIVLPEDGLCYAGHIDLRIKKGQIV